MRAWRIIKRIASAAAFTLAGLLIIGAVYQFIATRLDENNYKPSGQIVSIDGREVHFNCTGEGSPTVILEAGLGGGSVDWELVQGDAAKFTRVCSYDRAGIAWSSSGENPRNADRVAAELHRFLEIAKIAPPYVLAGHSIGGIYVQLFAARHPDEVMGIVLVDSSHPDQLTGIPGIPAFVPYAIKTTAPFGAARLVNAIEEVPARVSPEMQAKRAALYSSIRSAFTNADEMAAVADSLTDLRATPLSLGDKPLIVLSRGNSDGSTPEIEAKWRELQTDLVKLSLNGKQIIAAKSGHYIHFAEPELVVEAIREITTLAKTP